MVRFRKALLGFHLEGCYIYRNLIYRSCHSLAYTEHSLRHFVDSHAKDIIIARSHDVSRDPNSKYLNLSKRKATAEAAVLVPLCIVEEKTCLLFTIRSHHLNSHRGEVSFPGGKKDDMDSGLQETALRETEEELGIDREKLEIWAPLRKYPNRQATVMIYPFVCYAGEVDLNSIAINPKEVSEVIAIPVLELLHTRSQRYTTYKNGWRMPVFDLPDTKIWGLTATITDCFLNQLFPEIYNSKFCKLNKC